MLDSSFSHSSNQSSAHFLSTVLKLFPESNHFLAVPLRLPNCLHLSLGLNDTCAFTLTPYIPYTVVNSASWGIWWKSELDCICLCSEIFRGFPSPPLEAKSLGRPRGFLWPFQSHLPLLSPSFIQPQLHWLSHTLRHVPTSGSLPLLLPESPSMAYSHILPVSAQRLLSERSPLTTLVYTVPLPLSIPLYLPPTSFAFLNRDYHLLT